MKYIATILLLIAPLFAATHVINPSASGANTGADWTNAFTAIPGTLTCGDTYYIVGGHTYGNVPLGNCGVASTFKGATVADHGPAAGWSATFSVSSADGGSSAHFPQNTINVGNNWTFSGNSNTAVWDLTPSHYGFILDKGSCPAGVANGGIFLASNNTTGATVSYVAMTGCGTVTSPQNDYGANYGFFTNATTYNSNNKISHSYMGGYNACILFAMANNDVAEYNVCDGSWSTNANHGEMVNISNGSTGGNIFRYNWFRNANNASNPPGDGTGVMGLVFTANGNSCVGNTMQIYGNVVSSGQGGNGTFVTAGDNQAFCNTKFYNNTVYSTGDFSWACETGGTGCAASSGNDYKNNLVVSGSATIRNDSPAGALTVDHNSCFSCTFQWPTQSSGGQSVTGSPFVNAGTENFNLLNNPTSSGNSTTVAVGVSVSGTVSVDAFGNSYVGTNGWSRGALAFVNTGQASPPSCSPGSGNYTSTQTVTCTNPNGGTTVMCFTTNGATPATNGLGTGCTTGTVYTTTISVASAETINIIAGTSTLTDSALISYVYTFTTPVATPTFSPVAGTYTGTQTVTISSTTAGATFCSTIDGTTPTGNGAGTCTNGITGSTRSISATETLKAIGTENGFTDSAVASAAYTIINAATAPSCAPGSGTYNGIQVVTCTNPNSGTTVVCYTVDGTTPATNGSGTGCSAGIIYASTLRITENETLNVIAGTSTLSDSTVTSYAYVIVITPGAAFGTNIGIGTNVGIH